MAAGADKAKQRSLELFTQLGELVYTGDDWTRAYDSVCRAATALITGCDHASLMLRHGDQWSTAAATDDVAHTVDRLERELGAGPCVDAVLDATPQLAPDLTEPDAPWPVLREAVLRTTEVRGMLGCRIMHRQHKVAALNLFSDRPGGFTDEGVEQASIVAAFCTVALQAAFDQEEVRTLRDGLASNREIGKAVGLLMAYHRISDEEAFEILRTTSNRLNAKLATVADQVVAGHRRQLNG